MKKEEQKLHLTKTELDFIRYAKGGYPYRPTLQNALIVFTANQYRLPIGEVEHRNVVSFVSNLYSKLAAVDLIHFDRDPVESLLREFLTNPNYTYLDFYNKFYADVQFLDVELFELPSENNQEIVDQLILKK